MTQKRFFKSKKTATILLSVAVVIMGVSTLSSPASSRSANPCASCHPQYAEYLDILEGDVRNHLPVTIRVGENRNVTVVVQNIANTPTNAVMSSVSLTLRSQNGHFTVKTATYNVPGLPQWGTTATATWQITGVSSGTDALLISAAAYNPHPGISFADAYSPAQLIVVSETSIPEFPTSTLLTAFFFAILIAASMFVKLSPRHR